MQSLKIPEAVFKLAMAIVVAVLSASATILIYQTFWSGDQSTSTDGNRKIAELERELQLLRDQRREAAQQKEQQRIADLERQIQEERQRQTVQTPPVQTPPVQTPPVQSPLASPSNQPQERFKQAFEAADRYIQNGKYVERLHNQIIMDLSLLLSEVNLSKQEITDKINQVNKVRETSVGTADFFEYKVPNGNGLDAVLKTFRQCQLTKDEIVNNNNLKKDSRTNQFIIPEKLKIPSRCKNN